jgi:hypothetical protein
VDDFASLVGYITKNWKEKSLVFISLGESKVLFSVCFLLSKGKRKPFLMWVLPIKGM